MNEATVKTRLRPTLLVITADAATPELAGSLAAVYASHMTRLTQKFSRRSWNIGIIDINTPDATAHIWQAMEKANMAIVTGYEGSAEQRRTIERVMMAAQPVATLINAVAAQADAAPFSKAVSLLPGTIDDHMILADKALKDARRESALESSGAQNISLQPGSFALN